MPPHPRAVPMTLGVGIWGFKIMEPLEEFNIEMCGRDARTTKIHRAGIVVRASRPHIADVGPVPFRSSILNIAGGPKN